MAPTNSKANYKTYEAQARMVRAIVAAHPDVKWNYKDIAKYFGQSTADGIQFQFRGIKKDADQLRQTHSSGGDVANCLSLPPGTSTPTKAARTPGSRKRPRAEPKPSSPEPSDNEEDWSDRDESPSKRASKRAPAQKNGARKAAVRASATIAAGSALDSDSDVVLVKPESQYQTIFGGDAAAASTSSTASVAGAFTERATDPVFSTAFGANLYLGSFEEAIDAYGDGEI
ncbi:hypothetical protein J3458_003649 [Metarhizium acridum]|uniref:uncharacterized protein n=1 Tax=Metarhizium acridum TaxID=92637 RepID=UPI001C6C4095|nr:hypothetical protein J3458_003649 [Metarhizium acridum]